MQTRGQVQAGRLRFCSQIGAPSMAVFRTPPRVPAATQPGHAGASQRRRHCGILPPTLGPAPDNRRWTQAPSRLRHRHVVPRHGWHTLSFATKCDGVNVCLVISMYVCLYLVKRCEAMRRRSVRSDAERSGEYGAER